MRTSACGEATRMSRWIRGSTRSGQRWPRTKRCMFTSSTFRSRLDWLGACSKAPEKNRDRDHREDDHQKRGELRLPQAEDDLHVLAVIAEEEAPGRVQPEVDQTEHPVGQPRLQLLVERQDQREDQEREQHLVSDLGVDHLARL